MSCGEITTSVFALRFYYTENLDIPLNANTLFVCEHSRTRKLDRWNKIRPWVPVYLSFGEADELAEWRWHFSSIIWLKVNLHKFRQTDAEPKSPSGDEDKEERGIL